MLWLIFFVEIEGGFGAKSRLGWDTKKNTREKRLFGSCRGGMLTAFSSFLIMGRAIRTIDNESGIVEITARTLQGRHLMRPSPEANDLILGVLGRAQAKYETELYSFVFLSNHTHLQMKVEGVQQMSSFMGFLNGNLAKELGRLYDWREKFWGRRYTHICIADTEEDQIRRFLYILENGCKEGLVASPLEWCGVSSARALFEGETILTGTWYDRTAQYVASLKGDFREFPSTETVRLSPLPCLADKTPEERKEFVIKAVCEIEERTREHHRREKSRPMGVRAILRQDPHSKPSEFDSSPAPTFHAVNREDYRNMAYVRHEKITAYRMAAERLKRGELDVRFPEDCFPPRLPVVESRAPT